MLPVTISYPNQEGFWSTWDRIANCAHRIPVTEKPSTHSDTHEQLAQATGRELLDLETLPCLHLGRCLPSATNKIPQGIRISRWQLGTCRRYRLRSRCFSPVSLRACNPGVRGGCGRGITQKSKVQTSSEE